MKQFDARRLIILTGGFAALRLSGSNERDSKTFYSDDAVEYLLKDLEDTVQFCTELGLSVGRHKANEIISQLRNKPAQVYDVGLELGQLDSIIHIETETHVFLFIEPTKAHLYSEPELFGHEVTIRFPSTQADIEEAGKCLALNRGTACVFHSMRVMEVGLYAVAHELNIANIQENWHNAIEQIERAVRVLPRQTATEKADLEFFSEAAAHFFNVKEPWRNRTAHIGRIYTEEKAEQIFDSVRGFMQGLATRLGEQPL